MKNTIKLAVVASLAMMLAACGGGGGGSDSSNPNGGDNPDAKTVQTTGTAAVGFPIVGGSVALKCASGATTSTSTGSDGTYTATLKDSDYPCASSITGGTVNGAANADALYSVAPAPGVSNITPVTDLIFSGVTGGVGRTAYFDSLSPTQIHDKLNGSNINAQISLVAALLKTLPGKPSLDALNPITGEFKADKGTDGDQFLEQVSSALKAANLTQDTAGQKVAANQPLTKQAFSALAFTTPNVTSFNIGSSINLDDTFGIAIADPNRQQYSAKANIDADGNVTSFTDAGGFTGVVSTLGNRVGMLCAANAGQSMGQYVFASSDLVAVTDPTELAGKQFAEYQDCAQKDVATFDAAGNVHYSNGESDTGIFAAFADAGKMMDGSTVHYKAYKYTDSTNVVTYVYLLVANKTGSTDAVINDDTDYVMVGVQRQPS